MTQHRGGDLTVHGPHSVGAKKMASALKSAAESDRADGPPEKNGHPPQPAARGRRAASARSGSVAEPGSVMGGNPPATPSPTKSWQATLQSKGGFPADAQIAVSTTHVMVTSRQVLRYYDKNGNPLGSTIGSTAFFTAGLNLKDAAGNPIDRFNDLRVIFDSYRKRFWVTAYAGFSGAASVPAAKRRTFIPIAVSKTQNPLDGWYFYWWDGAAQQGQAGSSIWQPGDAPDYPIIGIDKPLSRSPTPSTTAPSGTGALRSRLPIRSPTARPRAAGSSGISRIPTAALRG
jgi:hypothetical protein